MPRPPTLPTIDWRNVFASGKAYADWLAAGESPENQAKMEQEMEMLQRDLKAVEKSYGQNVLSLTVARSYIRKLLENPEIQHFLNAQYADVLQEFTALVEHESL